LIRTPDDFGTVYLLDSRFGRQDIEAQIASWARMNMSKPKTFEEFVNKIKEINKIKELSPEMTSIQKDLGLVSIRGQSLDSDAITMPIRSARQSISRPINIPTEKELQE